MDRHQIVGRHGSYATQFWRNSSARQHPTRAALRAAYSRKAVDRRLVLPLDQHNWVRALEVLQAGYARPGRTAEHFQSVVRDMVEQAVSETARRRSTAINIATPVATAASSPPVTPLSPSRSLPSTVSAGVDFIRDAAYAGSIPANVSLWVSLLWAYCKLQNAPAAYETFQQAQRRFSISDATLQHMAELLLPVICMSGMADEATELYKRHLEAVIPSANGGQGRQRLSERDDREMRRWLMEAAARQGNWSRVLQSAVESSGADAEGATRSSGATVGRSYPDHLSPLRHCDRNHHYSTINSLFHGHDSSRSADTTPVTGGEPPASPAAMDELSREGAQQLFLSLCRTGCHVQEAKACWNRLYSANSMNVPPPLAHLREYLNCLAVGGEWREVVAQFCHLYLGRDAAVYLNASAGQLEQVVLADDVFATPTAHARPQLPMDEVVLNIVFRVFPLQTQPREISASDASPTSAGNLAIPAATHPIAMVLLLDHLLLYRDDVVLTNQVMAAVGPALLQVGQVDRLLRLLQHTPLLHPISSRRQPHYMDEMHLSLKRQLVNLLYAAYALLPTPHQREDVVRRMPHLFPPEIVKQLARMPSTTSQNRVSVGGMPVHGCPRESLERDWSATPAAQQARSRTTPINDSAITAPLSDPSSSAFSESKPTVRRTGVRNRQSYFPPRSSTTLTELAETAMRRDFVRLQATKSDAFGGTHADASRDPRPIPKGLHDHASGWDFYGRGGEMVFSNHKRTPNPLSMQPKVMRALRNPYRGWRVQENSSLAHRENVRKWNGKSSV